MFTNKTENLNLPQWVASDIPNWDVDLNGGFKNISDYVTTVNSKFTEYETTISELNETVTSQGNTITALSNRLEELENNVIVTGKTGLTCEEYSSLGNK